MSNIIHVLPEDLLVETTRLNWEKLQTNGINVQLVSASNPPVYACTHFLVNIGPDPLKPVLLDLRFAPIGKDKYIALLMTDQRTTQTLDGIAKQLVAKLSGLEFDAVVAPQSLGPLLSTAIARIIDPFMLCGSIMKGKPTIVQGQLYIGHPKQWINPNIYEEFRSGTSTAGSVQRFYLDDTFCGNWAKEERGTKVLFVDDARLTEGTIRASLNLLAKHRIKVAGVATVLNEHQQTKEINGVPYFYLTKLPLFEKTELGFVPIEGTYGGLEQFYVEV